MKKNMSKKLSIFLTAVLIAAMALVGCGNNAQTQTQTADTSVEDALKQAAEELKEDLSSAGDELKDALGEIAEAAQEMQENLVEAAQEVQEDVAEAMNSDVTVLGEGQTEFNFEVTDADGNVTKFQIHTDETVVGPALVNLGLIDGDESEWGLYVKTVNGITADYDVDQSYWAFYVDGEYAMTGVDSTDITAGSTYAFKVEK